MKYTDNYEINPTKDLEKHDREHLIEMVADYLREMYGDISSFDIKVVGRYEVATLEYKGKKR